jgi:hypothetical protein
MGTVHYIAGGSKNKKNFHDGTLDDVFNGGLLRTCHSADPSGKNVPHQSPNNEEGCTINHYFPTNLEPVESCGFWICDVLLGCCHGLHFRQAQQLLSSLVGIKHVVTLFPFPRSLLIYLYNRQTCSWPDCCRGFLSVRVAVCQNY